jgi:hypothetical protein
MLLWAKFLPPPAGPLGHYHILAHYSHTRSLACCPLSLFHWSLDASRQDRSGRQDARQPPPPTARTARPPTAATAQHAQSPSRRLAARSALHAARKYKIGRQVPRRPQCLCLFGCPAWRRPPQPVRQPAARRSLRTLPARQCKESAGYNTV